MNKATKIALLVLALGIMLFIIIRAYSFQISLCFEGLESYDIDIVEHDYDGNGDEFKIVKTYSNDNELVLAVITKNNMGFWNISSIDESTTDSHLAKTAWIKGGGLRIFEPNDTPFVSEWNFVYCGTNAKKLIEFLPGQIPENVTVNIRQAGKEFCIHVITFADPDASSNFDVIALLKTNQCIPYDKTAKQD